MIYKIQQYAKFIVAVVGAALTAFSQFIPMEYSEWVTAGLAFLTAISVLAVPNALTESQLDDVFDVYASEDGTL
jgi:hypothetical protein